MKESNILSNEVKYSTQETTEGQPPTEVQLAYQPVANYKDKYDALEELCHDLLDLANQLEPGMLVSSKWTQARNRFIKEFMGIAGLLPELGGV
jgi:hypothetical protein